MEKRKPEETMNLLFCVNRKFLTLFVSCLTSIARSGGYGH